MFKRFVTLLAIIAMLIAGIRFARVASVCEIGWGFVATQWQDALGLMGLGHTPIGHYAPSEQADFWLGEVDRVLRHHPNSPSIHMGAAWVLDSPGIGFLKNHVQQTEFAKAFPQFGLQLDEDAISREKSAFREKCNQRCVEVARLATEYDPTDVRWWRMRALLLFEGDALYSGQGFEPRASDWLAVLDQCSTHDPENALYDYLAALQLWNASASYDWPIDDQSANTESGEDIAAHNSDGNPSPDTERENEYWILKIRDSQGFASGVERFERAQEQPFLAIGEAGYSSIAEFLANSRLRKADQAEIAISRLVTVRQSTLFYDLWRWQNVRVDDARRARDHQTQLRLLRQNLRLYDQAIAPEETSALTTLQTYGRLRESTYEALKKLAETRPTVIDPGDLASIRQREEELRIRSSILQMALQRLEDARHPTKYATSWSAVFAVVTSTSAVALLITAGLFMLAARLS